jgi:hypothetical protein
MGMLHLSSQCLAQEDPQTLQNKKNLMAIVKLERNMVNYNNDTSYDNNNKFSP